MFAALQLQEPPATAQHREPRVPLHGNTKRGKKASTQHRRHPVGAPLQPRRSSVAASAALHCIPVTSSTTQAALHCSSVGAPLQPRRSFNDPYAALHCSPGRLLGIGMVHHRRLAPECCRGPAARSGGTAARPTGLEMRASGVACTVLQSRVGACCEHQ